MHELIEAIGDYKKFFATQRARLTALGIDISSASISHIAYRTPSYEEYLEKRNEIERHCVANVENVWNGRPISKMLLKEPIDLGDGFQNKLIELIPPVHQNLYKMGLEHLGVVFGDAIDEFSRKHREVLTGQQFQSAACEPCFVRFDDHTMVKFYRYSLHDVCVKEGLIFDGFQHVDDWVAEPG